LGEALSPRQPWDNGAAPVFAPLFHAVGSDDCFVAGETLESGLALTDGRRFESWPAACFISAPLEDFGWASAVYRCAVQSWWASRLNELNIGQVGVCVAQLEQRFNDADVHFFAGDFFAPPITTVVHPEYTIIIYEATQNAAQALVEVIEGVQAPENFGLYGTTEIWNEQAMRGIRKAAIRGAGNTEPILLIGYSYGGASAMVAAGILRLANAGRTVRYLTFGAPKPGDRRLRDLITLPTVGCAVANDNDFITSIPWNAAQLTPIIPILLRNLLRWADWYPPLETWLLFADGHVVQNAYPQPSGQEILDLIELVWTTGTLFGYPAHQITIYLDRTNLRCPGNPAPANGMMAIGPARFPNIGLAGEDGHLLDARVAITATRRPPGVLGVGPGVARSLLGLAEIVPVNGLVGLAEIEPVNGLVGLAEVKPVNGLVGLAAPKRPRGALELAAGAFPPIVTTFVSSGGTAAVVTTATIPSFSFPGGEVVLIVGSFASGSIPPNITATYNGVPLTRGLTQRSALSAGYGVALTTFSGNKSAGTASIVLTSATGAMMLWCVSAASPLLAYAVDILGSATGANKNAASPTLTTKKVTSEYLIGAYAGIQANVGTSPTAPFLTIAAAGDLTTFPVYCLVQSNYYQTSALGAYTFSLSTPATSALWCAGLSAMY
jgi:Lipase (class 3)